MLRSSWQHFLHERFEQEVIILYKDWLFPRYCTILLLLDTKCWRIEDGQLIESPFGSRNLKYRELTLLMQLCYARPKFHKLLTLSVTVAWAVEKKSKANLMHIYCCRQLIQEMRLPKLFMQACLTGLLSVSISHLRLARYGQEGQSAYWIFMVSNLLRLVYYICSQQCLFWVSGCWPLLLQGKSLRVSNPIYLI